MNLFSKISFKILVPITILVVSLISCSKGDEPVPSVSIDASNEASAVVTDGATGFTSRTSKQVVGGDDSEDDDDNKDVRVIVH